MKETRLHDKSVYEDVLVMRDEIRNGKHGPNSFATEIMVIDDETGEVIHRGTNMTILGGRTFLLEKYFGIPYVSTKHLLLNDMMGIPHSLTQEVLMGTHQRCISSFMIGNGAANQSVPGKYYTPKDYETKLYKPSPFRCVPFNNDLSPTDQSKYRFKKLITIDGSDYWAYFAKKIEVNNLILEFNNGDYTPLEEDTRPVFENDSSHRLGGGSILSYIQFTMAIDKDEFKEYYRYTHANSLDGAGIDEFGLVLGADLADPGNSGRNELAAAELASKFTTLLSPMQSESSRRSVLYRVYS